MVRLGILFVTLALTQFRPEMVLAQGQALPPIKVNLPPSPNFDVATAPVQYPTGELSVYGLRKGMSKYLDKDVRVKAYLLELYECPAEIRKCNDDAAAKAKRERGKKPAASKNGLPPSKEPSTNAGCRPCDQPHFYLADTPQTRKERSLVVADYPVKDPKTGKAMKPLILKAGEQYVVTGTFAINSMTGFAASNGLIVHKKLEDAQGKVVAEGNAVLPPEAQTINVQEQGSGAAPAKK
jgi:hypothetical protein